MKIDEYVPTAIPTNSASARSFKRAGTQDVGTDEEQARDRQQADDRGVDRAHQRLVDREVGRLAVRHPARRLEPAGVLLHLVEDDDGVVEGVAQDGEHTDHRRRGHLEPD